MTDDDRARLKEIATAIDDCAGGDVPFDLDFAIGAIAFLDKLAEQSSGDQGLRELTARGRLSFLYSDEDADCTCCDGQHCFAYGIQLDDHAMGTSGFSEMVSEFARPLRHKGMEERPVEVSIRLLAAALTDNQERE